MFNTNNYNVIVMTKTQYNDWLDDNFIELSEANFITPDEVKVKTREEVTDILERLTNRDFANMKEKQFLERALDFGFFLANDVEDYFSYVGEIDDYVILITEIW